MARRAMVRDAMSQRKDAPRHNLKFEMQCPANGWVLGGDGQPVVLSKNAMEDKKNTLTARYMKMKGFGGGDGEYGVSEAMVKRLREDLKEKHSDQKTERRCLDR